MPVKITSSTFADEYNSGTTGIFQGNVGDKIDIEIDFYYELSYDADISSLFSLDFFDPISRLGSSTQYSSNAVMQVFASGLSQSELDELIGKEITIQILKALIMERQLC